MMSRDGGARNEVLALEAERCRAISDEDWPALEALLADDLTHTHLTGITQDKATYLAHVRRNPRRTTRGDLTVRIYGDVAVVVGPQVNVLDEGFEQPSVGLQVWVRRPPAWELVASGSSGRRA
jgi:hypothetical protein